MELQQPKVCIQIFTGFVFYELFVSMSTKVGKHCFVNTYCLLREVVGKTLFIQCKGRTLLNLTCGLKDVLSAK